MASRAARLLRRSFVGGLLVLVPIAVTVWVVMRIVAWLDRLFGSVTARLDQWVGVHVPATGVVLTLGLLLVVGFLGRYAIVRKAVAAWERFVARVPVVRTLYAAARHLTDVLSHPPAALPSHVGIFESPRRGVYLLGVAMGEVEVRTAPDRVERLTTVFSASGPNLFTSVMVFLPPGAIRPLELTIGDAVKIALSAGVIYPAATGRGGPTGG